jgi:hypothetical protein
VKDEGLLDESVHCVVVTEGAFWAAVFALDGVVDVWGCPNCATETVADAVVWWCGGGHDGCCWMVNVRY